MDIGEQFARIVAFDLYEGEGSNTFQRLDLIDPETCLPTNIFIHSVRKFSGFLIVLECRLPELFNFHTIHNSPT